MEGFRSGLIYGKGANGVRAGMKKAATDGSDMGNVIYIEPFEATAGKQLQVSLRMKNTAEIRGFQFDLYLPEGMTAVKNAQGRIACALSDGRLPVDDEHTLTADVQADGAIRFLCGSLYDETFTGTDGEIAVLTIDVAKTVAAGEYPVVMRNMKLTESDINKFYTAGEVESTVTVKGSSMDIAEIEEGKMKVDDYVYDILGRRVESSALNLQSARLKKGVYVRKGRKMVVR